MVNAYGAIETFGKVRDALGGDTQGIINRAATKRNEAPAVMATPAPTRTASDPGAAADPLTGGISQTEQEPQLSAEDMQKLINGDMLPILVPLLTHAVDAFNAGPPQQGDYPDEVSWQNAQDDYYGPDGDGPLKTIISLATQVTNARKLVDGKLTLGDGTVITQDMINSDDPYVAAQAKRAYEDAARQSVTEYNTTMNQAGLDQFTVNNTAANTENDRRLAEFNAQTNSYNAGLDYDKTAISRAADDVNRQLNGLQESRARADLATKTLLDAAPYATQDGKKDFTANDFGAGVAGLARAGATDPSKNFLSFPTTVSVDPAALMAQGDAALGVQGALPLIPQMTTQPNTQPVPQPLVQGPAPVNVSRVGPPPSPMPGTQPLVGGPGSAVPSGIPTLADLMQQELQRQLQIKSAQEQGIFG